MEFFQISIKGLPPQGPLYETRADAYREVRMLKVDDRRYADDAMREMARLGIARGATHIVWA